ncbi:MAG: hypothetical protein HPZ79_04030 [Oscillospiraceae bacterium]|nr:hypothetical protein [Oscillospiraceae bacterium]
MNGFEEMEKKLEQTGKMNRLKAIAESNDGKALADALDTKKVEQAARSGDTAALKAILSQVLNTDEGKRLAEKVKDAMQDG